MARADSSWCQLDPAAGQHEVLPDVGRPLGEERVEVQDPDEGLPEADNHGGGHGSVGEGAKRRGQRPGPAVAVSGRDSLLADLGPGHGQPAGRAGDEVGGAG